jgi:hypothetical protein
MTNDQPPAPAGPGGEQATAPAIGPEATSEGESATEPGGAPGDMDDAREADLIRQVIRAQERHREGGVEPDREGTADSGTG